MWNDDRHTHVARHVTAPITALATGSETRCIGSIDHVFVIYSGMHDDGVM